MKTVLLYLFIEKYLVECQKQKMMFYRKMQYYAWMEYGMRGTAGNFLFL